MWDGVTEEYERHFWDELNALLAEVVPPEASQEEAEHAITAAVAGADNEIADLYWRVVNMSRADPNGFIRERMEEDNPISAVRRRLGHSGEYLPP
jgi:hypothetical protein